MEERIKPPTPPTDRHLREGELPKRPKYRLIKEVVNGHVALYRIEKRGLFGWKIVWPDGMEKVLGGVPDEARAKTKFDYLIGRIKDHIEVIDQA